MYVPYLSPGFGDFGAKHDTIAYIWVEWNLLIRWVLWGGGVKTSLIILLVFVYVLRTH